MPSAVTSLRCLAMMYALTGLWIQPALPCWIDSLLLASDHDSTSGSMQSRNIFLYHSIVCTVAGELMRTVLPSLSTSMPPKDHSTGPDRKSTRLNSSHVRISYAVFCLKKKKKNNSSDHAIYD